MTPTRQTSVALSAALTLGIAPPLALGGEAADSGLRLDLSGAYSQPAAGEGTPPAPASGSDAPATQPDPSGQAAPASDGEKRFGRAGSKWWSIGSGIAYDFDSDTDVNLHGIYSFFLADELEFGVEAAGWYFDQQGPNTGGLSGSMIFRWHAWHWGGDDGFRSTVFGDVGIGLLAGFDDVPNGGTSLNFLPRIGAGFTHALTEDESGPRLTLGLRWHHISNARIEGEERNPARDSLMIYAEVQFPF